MMVFEAVHIYIKLMLLGIALSGVPRLNFMERTKCMSHDTLWISLGHEENFFNNSSREELTVTAMVL